MRNRFVRCSMAALASLAPVAGSGCDESSTLVLEPNPAVRIVINSSNCPQIQRCSQCQLLYEAYDKNSKPAQFPTILWTSENPSIATVDAAGRVQGWATGSVTIVAEVLETGASDQANITVIPPFNPAVTCTPPAALGVPPGQR